MFYIWKKGCDYSEKWQQCAYLENEFYACFVGEPAEKCLAYAYEAVGQSEEQAGHHSYLVGL